MNIANQQLDKKFEQAASLLCQHPHVHKERKKSLIMHSLRVGMYLYDNNYSEDVVIGGLLHDMFEWTDNPEQKIKDEYGQKVSDIVQANTKNRDIEDVDERRKDYVGRCTKVGDEALIVKAADVLDSHRFYQATENQEEIDRSVAIAKLIIETGLKDKIVDELNEIV